MFCVAVPVTLLPVYNIPLIAPDSVKLSVYLPVWLTSVQETGPTNEPVKMLPFGGLPEFAAPLATLKIDPRPENVPPVRMLAPVNAPAEKLTAPSDLLGGATTPL